MCVLQRTSCGWALARVTVPERGPAHLPAEDLAGEPGDAEPLGHSVGEPTSLRRVTWPASSWMTAPSNRSLGTRACAAAGRRLAQVVPVSFAPQADHARTYERYYYNKTTPTIATFPWVVRQEQYGRAHDGAGDRERPLQRRPPPGRFEIGRFKVSVRASVSWPRPEGDGEMPMSSPAGVKRNSCGHAMPKGEASPRPESPVR